MKIIKAMKAVCSAAKAAGRAARAEMEEANGAESIGGNTIPAINNIGSNPLKSIPDIKVETVKVNATMHMETPFENMGLQPKSADVSIEFNKPGFGVAIDGVGRFYCDMCSTLAIREIFMLGICLHEGGRTSIDSRRGYAAGHYVFTDMDDTEQ